MLRFCSLASGSAGNATLVEASDGARRPTRLLIDCGLGPQALQQRLAACGLTPQELDGIFITHEHADHVGCAPALAARHRIPLWASAGTLQALREGNASHGGGDAPPIICHTARDGQPLAIGALQLLPFTVPHDAREPLQLRCTDGQRSLGLLTDLGHLTAHALRQLQGCHALILESNHDPALLAASRYPPFLKRRIAGPHGHLSNAQATEALRQLHHAQLSIVVGAHLSERNNQPALARAALAAALGCAPQDILLASRHGLACGWLPV